MAAAAGSIVEPMAAAARREPRLADFIAVSAAVVAGHLGPISQPYQIGTAIEAGGLSRAGAGWFMGVEIACYALTLMAVARFVTHLDLRRLAFVGAVISLIAFALAGLALGTRFIFPAAALIGVAQGLVFSTSIAAASRTGAPEKLVGVAGMTALIFFAVFMVVTPIVQGRWGSAILFVELGVCLLLAGSGLFLLPRAAAEGAPARVKVDRHILLFMVQLFLYGAATGAVYAFMERMGDAIGILPRENGIIMMAGILCGAGGSALAGRIGQSYGLVKPLVVSLMLIGLSSFAIANPTGTAVFVLGVIGYQIFYSFAYPYLIGAAIQLSGGALASFTGGFIFLATAIGAVAAGSVADRWSYGALGFVALIGCLLAIAAIPRPLRVAHGM